MSSEQSIAHPKLVKRSRSCASRALPVASDLPLRHIKALATPLPQVASSPHQQHVLPATPAEVNMSPPLARKLAASQLPKCASAAYRAPVHAAGRRTYCATGLVTESRPSRNTLQASRRTVPGIEFSTTSAQRRSFASTSSKMTSLQEIKKNCRKVRLQSPLNEDING